MAAITLFLFKQGSRNAYNQDRKDKHFQENYEKLFAMKLPHLDNTDAEFRESSDIELEKVNPTCSVFHKNV